MRKMGESQTRFEMRKQFSIEEDPWDNYLYHDSKQLIQLLAHQGLTLSASEQVILSKFIINTVEDEAISQYKIDGKQIIKLLLEFVKTDGSANASQDG